MAKTIESELMGGDVQEAFHHLKGWYRDASSTSLWLCYLSLEKQTAYREALYRSDPRGGPT